MGWGYHYGSYFRKEKEGLDELLENILLVAEMQELKANPNREAYGIVVEAQLDKTEGRS